MMPLEDTAIQARLPRPVLLKETVDLVRLRKDYELFLAFDLKALVVVKVC